MGVFMKLIFNKSIVYTAILTSFLSSQNIFSFSDNFESYTIGSGLVIQNNVDWTTWSLPYTSTEDPIISDAFSFSQYKSVKIVQDNHLVKPLGNATSGLWYLYFHFYIPPGNAGHFATLALFENPSIYNLAMQCHFDPDGNGRLFNGSTTPVTFSYQQGTWLSILLRVDISCNKATLYLGTNRIGDSWQWTNGAFGSGCPLQLASINFYGTLADNEMYIDDFYFGGTFDAAANIASGWNLVSIPGNMGLNTPDEWWSYRTGLVWKYCNGYVNAPSLTPGCGYWMKHQEPRTYNTGDEWTQITLVPCGTLGVCCPKEINVDGGWNLIGIFDREVIASEITTNPPGLISGYIYGFSNGYYSATVLVPGQAYWIKLTGAGEIILP